MKGNHNGRLRRLGMAILLLVPLGGCPRADPPPTVLPYRADPVPLPADGEWTFKGPRPSPSPAPLPQPSGG